MTRIISISLSKGGVGKTTTAVNLSAALAISGRRVLLIDTDTQAQAGKALGFRPETGLADFILGQVSFAEAIIEARPHLHLLAGGHRLAAIKQVIAEADMRQEETLSAALTPHIKNYHYVILDTSPGWDNLQINVLFFAQEVLTPVNLEVLSLDGLVEFSRRIDEVRRYHDLTLRYVLPTALDRRVKQSSEIMPQLKQHFDGIVCTPIRYNVRLSEAPAHGQHIFEYDPQSNGAKDYAALTKRIVEDEQT
ncbi:MAG: chromosome partitioning protein ParA [Chloroflexi bacterium]|nr:MAG: chromosome partitioning protein ParA [Chloroflexota bacterium]